MSRFSTLPSHSKIGQQFNNGLEPDIWAELQKDEGLGLSFTKSYSSLENVSSLSGHGRPPFISTTQESTISSDMKKVWVVGKFSVSENNKISSSDDSNFDGPYNMLSSNGEIQKDDDSSQIIKSRRFTKSCPPSTLSEHEITNYTPQILQNSVENTIYVDMESFRLATLSSEIQMPLGIGLCSKVRKMSLSAVPPSLDGSLSSDQLGHISTPSTPNFERSIEAQSEDWNGGVQLQPAAMATLQAISSPKEAYEEYSKNIADVTPRASLTLEMQQRFPQVVTSIHQNNSFLSCSTQQNIESSLIRLEIPSPMRFLSTALSPGTRHTWHFDSPSSHTAEAFYRTPSAPTTVQSDDEYTRDTSLDNLTPLSQAETQTLQAKVESNSSLSFLTRAKVSGGENFPNFSHLSNETGDFTDTNLDRTSFWVAFQQSISSEISSNACHRSEEVTNDNFTRDNKIRQESSQSPPTKSDCSYDDDFDIRRESLISSQDIEFLDLIHYHVFQSLISRISNHDTFIHRVPRYEALQSQRVSFPSVHRAQLLGNYQISDSPTGAKYRLLTYIDKETEIEPSELEKLRRNLENEVLVQILSVTWSFMALKFLKGGCLLTAPVSKKLAISRTKDNDLNSSQIRVLDLGGLGVCDWAWYFAIEYPETKVYTLTPRTFHHQQNSRICGPSNHRNILVDRLVKLPFKDDQFDLISARELYTALKLQGESGIDEWEACLRECFRVLKPGGYLEFDVMDSEIMNAGPLGLVKNFEFSLSLKSLGYDSNPTQQWTTRLDRIGFVDIQRAWLFLPMGGGMTTRIHQHAEKTNVNLDSIKTLSGSTADVATISGLFGSWAWERWLLRCKLQMGEDPEDDFKDIQAIILEGNKCGAGWRFLTGQARKPLYIS